MERLTVHIERCVQNLQEVQVDGSSGDLMRSRVFFRIEHNGRSYSGLYVDLLLTHEANLADSENSPIEVTKPQGGYRGPFNYAIFRDRIDHYYRRFICGPNAFAICIQGGKNIIAENNRFDIPWTFEIEANEQGGGW